MVTFLPDRCPRNTYVSDANLRYQEALDWANGPIPDGNLRYQDALDWRKWTK